MSVAYSRTTTTPGTKKKIKNWGNIIVFHLFNQIKWQTWDAIIVGSAYLNFQQVLFVQSIVGSVAKANAPRVTMIRPRKVVEKIIET